MYLYLHFYKNYYYLIEKGTENNLEHLGQRRCNSYDSLSYSQKEKKNEVQCLLPIKGHKYI